MSKPNYWCYRIDTDNILFFKNELLEHNRLRQGWGWDERQDLRNLQMDEGARRNQAMFENVKRGDILLVPRLPDWTEVAIVQAEEDWAEGYRFEIDKEMADFGHVFPAKYLKCFSRQNAHVSGNIRSTLRNPCRFWNINHYAADVEQLLKTPKDQLSVVQDHSSRLMGAVDAAFNHEFNHSEFAEQIYKRLNKAFMQEEWEFALVEGFRQMFPHYHVERVGGREEAKHGTDILIRLPSPLPEYQYAIAIQVKDYEGAVNGDVIEQIGKADEYYQDPNLKLIDKWIIFTRAIEDANLQLIDGANGIKIVFANELKEILENIGKAIIGIRCS